jgi:hypothetical protein
MKFLIAFVMRHRWAALTLGVVSVLAFSSGALWAFQAYRRIPTGELPAITLKEAPGRAQEGGTRAWVTLRDAAWNCNAYTSLDGPAYVSIGEIDDSPVVAMIPSIEECARASSAAPRGKLRIARARLQAKLLGADNKPGTSLVIVDMVDTPTILMIAVAFFAVMAALGLGITLWALRMRPAARGNDTLGMPGR